MGRTCFFINFAGINIGTIEAQIMKRKESLESFKIGIIRFMQGFSKKVLLANTMAVIADRAFSMSMEELTVSFAWFGAIAYTLQIYYDFCWFRTIV